MKNLILLVLGINFIIIFFQCKDNTPKTEKKYIDNTIDKMEIVGVDNESNNTKVQKDFFLFGHNNKLNYPLHFNKYGDRYFKTKNLEVHPLDTKFTSDLMKKFNVKYFNSDLNNGFSYGYDILNDNIIFEIIGFGFNDAGNLDDVDYEFFIITHNYDGLIIDYKSIGRMMNINSNLEFKEGYLIDKENFTIVEYDFIKTKVDEYGLKVPLEISLVTKKFKILSNGKINFVKESNPLKIDVNVEYNDFTGLFNDEDLLNNKEYWLPDNYGLSK